MSISMSRSIGSTRSVSSRTSPKTSQYHAAAPARSATASPTWSRRAASAMDIQPFGVAGQVRGEAPGRIALGADLAEAAVRLVREEPVLAPGEVGITQVDTGAVTGQRGGPVVNPAGVPVVIRRVGVDHVGGQVDLRLHRECHVRPVLLRRPSVPDRE